MINTLDKYILLPSTCKNNITYLSTVKSPTTRGAKTRTERQQEDPREHQTAIENPREIKDTTRSPETKSEIGANGNVAQPQRDTSTNFDAARKCHSSAICCQTSAVTAGINSSVARLSGDIQRGRTVDHAAADVRSILQPDFGKNR